ncbi:MAG TPA: DinB family protein [Longimicrobiales bacterium]
MSSAEPWLRGPVEGVTPQLQPIAHALLFAREELERMLPPLSAEQVWLRPGNIAPIGYHVRHCMGSVRRMLTYARGAALSDEQFAELKAEKADAPEMDGAALWQLAQEVLDETIAALRAMSPERLDEPRVVGRKQLPSNVRGLFSEIAVHTARHVGQIATTAKLL